MSQIEIEKKCSFLCFCFCEIGSSSSIDFFVEGKTIHVQINKLKNPWVLAKFGWRVPALKFLPRFLLSPISFGVGSNTRI